MKKLLFLGLLIVEFYCLGAARVSSSVAQVYDELRIKLTASIKDSSECDIWLKSKLERQIHSEINYLLRPVRDDIIANSEHFSKILSKAHISGALWFTSQKNYERLKQYWWTGSFAIILFDVQRFLQRIKLRREIQHRPTDPRFLTRASLSDFEWKIVEKLDVLMLNSYAELSEEERDMADKLLQALNALYPERYTSIEDLGLNKNEEAMAALVADTTNSDGTQRQRNTGLAQTMAELLS